MDSIQKQGIASSGSRLHDACSGAWVGGQVLLPLLTGQQISLTPCYLMSKPLLQTPERSLLYRCSKLIVLSIGRRPAPSLTSMKALSLDGHLQFHRTPRAHCQWEIVPSHPLSSSFFYWLYQPAPCPSDFSGMRNFYDIQSPLSPKLQGTHISLSLPPSCWDEIHSIRATPSPISKSPSASAASASFIACRWVWSWYPQTLFLAPPLASPALGGAALHFGPREWWTLLTAARTEPHFIILLTL